LPYALCPLRIFLLIDFNGHIRANSPAEGAGGTFIGIVADDVVIALLVEVLGHADDLFGTGDEAELASFTSLFFDGDFAHKQYPIFKDQQAACSRRLMNLTFKW
jgi:hypothetical protein